MAGRPRALDGVAHAHGSSVGRHCSTDRLRRTDGRSDGCWLACWRWVDGRDICDRQTRAQESNSSVLAIGCGSLTREEAGALARRAASCERRGRVLGLPLRFDGWTGKAQGCVGNTRMDGSLACSRACRDEYAHRDQARMFSSKSSRNVSLVRG